MIEIKSNKHGGRDIPDGLYEYENSLSYSYTESQWHDINLNLLGNFLKYLTRLKKEGKLSSGELSVLLSEVYSNYVANEIDLRVNRVLEKYL